MSNPGAPTNSSRVGRTQLRRVKINLVLVRGLDHGDVDPFKGPTNPRSLVGLAIGPNDIDSLGPGS